MSNPDLTRFSVELEPKTHDKLRAHLTAKKLSGRKWVETHIDKIATSYRIKK